MKPRSVLLTLTLGLMAGLFACQDGGVVAPDDELISPDDLVATLKKEKCTPWPSCNDDGGGTTGPTLALGGVFNGEATEGVSWSYKKELFNGNASQGSIEVTVDPTNLGECRVKPDGAAAGGQVLFDALAGLTGISAVLRVDMANAGVGVGEEGESSAVNRITSYVGDEVVRYFWIGPWGELGDATTTDATVSNFDDGAETITYTLRGGAVGVRDPGSPSRVVQIACANLGDVLVTITK